MVFEANTNHKPDSGNGTAVQAEVNTRLLGGGPRGSMPYIFVRENAIKYWCTVQARLNKRMIAGSRGKLGKLLRRPKVH